MLLIGTPIRTVIEIPVCDSVLPAGTEGFITEVHYGDHWPIAVLFNTYHPEVKDELVELDFDINEFEVLAKDICYCHLLQGKGQGDMGYCGVCA